MRIWDDERIKTATYVSRKTYDDFLRKFLAAQKDELYDKRSEIKKCRTCFYLRTNIIAGQSFTNSKCQMCEVVMVFTSTNVDKICSPCASTHNLCVYCGGNFW